ncbi:MAG: AI-2E family transporter [Lachnospiraceae bacterium]|nr:AI-2E family transporter [Lachnospiraceae bacterium]
MNKWKQITEKSWFNNAVALCIAVLFYVIITHLNVFGKAIAAIGSFVYPIFAGAIIAYLINPLMMLFYNKVFHKINKDKIRKMLSELSALLSVIIFIGLLLATLIPQLLDSILTFIKHIPAYVDSLNKWIGGFGASGLGSTDAAQNVINLSQEFFDSISEAFQENSGDMMDTSKTVGGHIGAWFIGFILAVYFLSAKEKIIKSFAHLALLIMKDNYWNVLPFIKKCNEILSKYIIYSIIEGIIVAVINAILMAIFGMSYIGMVSVTVGVTNLIPTFGPMIGAVIGAFILLLVNPKHALVFLIITAIIQTFDGYILKPKLYGDTFGVSGLWILIGVIVGGRMFGVIGILLAIPVVAMIDLLIKTWIAPKIKAAEAKKSKEHEDIDNGRI